MVYRITITETDGKIRTSGSYYGHCVGLLRDDWQSIEQAQDYLENSRIRFDLEFSITIYRSM